jgi:hypothetical protein
MVAVTGNEEVSWLGLVDLGAFPSPFGAQWHRPRSRRLQLRGQRRHRTGFPVSSQDQTSMVVLLPTRQSWKFGFVVHLDAECGFVS